MTGGDPIKCRRMRENEFEYLPEFKLIIAGNHEPSLPPGGHDGIYRRLDYLKMDTFITEPNPYINNDLKNEREKILTFLIPQVCYVLEHGLSPPPTATI